MLWRIRNCHISYGENVVEINGICTETEEQVNVILTTEEFDNWSKGVPINVAAPNLEEKQKLFLSTGRTQ